MILKVINDKTGKEKPLKDLTSRDLMFCKCDECGKEYSCEYRVKRFPLSSMYCTRCKMIYNCREKYGTDFHTQAKSVKKKIATSMIDRFGFTSAAKNKKVKSKIKNTNLKKYGVTCTLYELKTKQKKTETWQAKYGVDNPSKSQIIKDKVRATKRRNHTFNSSAGEDKVYQLLKEKYPKVIRQHSEERYPFACDFYIPSEDLFIEYNGFWTHTNEPFNADNKEHQEVLKMWEEKSKNSIFFASAIKTWTIRDVKKREIADSNKLNFVELFDLEEVQSFLESEIIE